MTLTLVIGTKLLCTAHFLTLVDLSVKMIEYTRNFGNENQSLLTLLYLSLEFDLICLALFELLWKHDL